MRIGTRYDDIASENVKIALETIPGIVRGIAVQSGSSSGS